MREIWYLSGKEKGNISDHFKAEEFQSKDKAEGLLISTRLLSTLEKNQRPL